MRLATKVGAMALLLSLPWPLWAQRGDCDGASASSWSIRLASQSEPGERLLVEGAAIDAETGSPLADLEILVYQTDASGLYSLGGSNEADARLCGVLRTDDSGRYRLATVLPGHYPSGGVPRHIHYVVRGGEAPDQHFELQFADDPLVAGRQRPNAPSWSRIRPVTTEDSGRLRVVKDLKVRRDPKRAAP